MRVNIYAEEMTDRIEIIGKTIDGHTFTGLRFYLELPVTIGGQGKHRSEDGSPQVFPPINGEPAQVAGPFIHRPDDDDSAAVTFWGKRDLRKVLVQALAALDEHYGNVAPPVQIPSPDDPKNLILENLRAATHLCERLAGQLAPEVASQYSGWIKIWLMHLVQAAKTLDEALLQPADP